MLWSASPVRGLPAPFPFRVRKPAPYESLFKYIEPGSDEFAVEKQAAEIAALLNRMPDTGALPLAPDFRGTSPLPARYREVDDGVYEAEFDQDDGPFEGGLRKWLDSLRTIRRARFEVLPEGRVRFEVSSAVNDELHYRVGMWKQSWVNGRLANFEPIEETLVKSPQPLFRDMTHEYFGGVESFEKQLRRGVPYWRARLDSACGIDVYGNTGIAMGDIDGDGCDEIYVCQPGGLPNRLYKNRDGRMEDITERWGAGVLDDTPSALFVDFRNIGRQDLLVLTVTGPHLFLNEAGSFRYKPDAFRFATRPQGTFTGMAAADYDRDGRVDVYFCTYVYFQSEDQYRYPIPYHDARNGPPNFLVHNGLTAEGGGFFEDVTSIAGADENNDRFSFAATWCDYDGDGWPDLYVVNDFGRNNLYKNENGRFRDVAAAAGVEDIGPGMSACWTDYDGDGRPDLYVSNMWTAAGQRVVAQKEFAPAADATLREAYRRHTKGNSLYHNRGDGTFDETGAAEGVEMGRWAWGSDAMDFDNDGSPEILVGCGMLTNSSERDLMSYFWRQVVARSPVTNRAGPEYENGWNAVNQLIREDYSWNGREPNVLYARRGRRFYDVSGVSGLDREEDTRAFGVTDIDGDGNLDLLVKNRLGPQLRVLRNEWGSARRAIAFELQGVHSNRDAIGACVEVHHSGRRSVQEVRAGSGYLSQHTKRLHFGLGNTPTAEKVEVRWPSGLVQQFADLAAGFCYRFVEGSNEISRRSFLKRKPATGVSVEVTGENQTGFDAAWLLEPVPLPHALTLERPGFVLLTGDKGPGAPAGVPVQTIDLTREAEETVACYGLFRRYVFDYRTTLTVPLLLLVDAQGRAHKIYPDVPGTESLQRDLRLLQDPGRLRLALPFAGRYFAEPRRNYFQLGAAFYWSGYPKRALVYLEEVIRRQPDNGRTHLAIGNIHLSEGTHDLAREHLEAAARLMPDSADAWVHLGSLEAALARYPAALRDFEKALAIRPEMVFALASAGQVHARIGDITAAEREFGRAMELDPRDADIADQLGLLLARQGRLHEARKNFQKAIALQRDHASAINNLGVLYIQLGQVDDAVAAFRYGIEVAPDDETLYLNLARTYVQTGDRSRAFDVLRRLLLRKPESGVARKALRELGEH
ncbi:MAG: repeat-containing protein [Candidatus Solibacter sp.]|nr:repeat-containing protein [Candidatus Solibacter sp.]